MSLGQGGISPTAFSYFPDPSMTCCSKFFIFFRPVAMRFLPHSVSGVFVLKNGRLSDYILYLFIFLPRATTGLATWHNFCVFFNKTGGCGTMLLRLYRFLPPKVARALPSGRPKAARCLGTALSTALVLGCGLSLLHSGEDSSASSDLKLLDF